jgi:hypothetical protein
MNVRDCAHERNVIEAAESGVWTESLRAHVAACETCEAAASVSSWMLELARIDDRQHILPDPAVVWLKAQLLRQRVAVERVSRPITQVQIVAYMVVAAGWAALLATNWRTINGWLTDFQPSHLVIGASTGALSVSFTLLAAIIILSSITAGVALHTILAEE